MTKESTSRPLSHLNTMSMVWIMSVTNRHVCSIGFACLAQKVIRSHPVNSTTTCYFNPRNRAEAVLNKQFSWFPVLFVVVPIPFILLGITIAWFSLSGKLFNFGNSRQTNRTSQLSNGVSSTSTPFATGKSIHLQSDSQATSLHPADKLDEEWNKPMKLEPEETRRCASTSKSLPPDRKALWSR